MSGEQQGRVPLQRNPMSLFSFLDDKENVVAFTYPVGYIAVDDGGKLHQYES
jgi:hypothetical protein